MFLGDVQYSFHKMPAYAGKVDEIYLPAIGLVLGLRNADAEFTGEVFFRNFFVEFVCAADAYTDHEIFRKFPVIKFLKDELAIVSLKPGRVAGIPFFAEAEFQEQFS